MRKKLFAEFIRILIDTFGGKSTSQIVKRLLTKREISPPFTAWTLRAFFEFRSWLLRNGGMAFLAKVYKRKNTKIKNPWHTQELYSNGPGLKISYFMSFFKTGAFWIIHHFNKHQYFYQFFTALFRQRKILPPTFA